MALQLVEWSAGSQASQLREDQLGEFVQGFTHCLQRPQLCGNAPTGLITTGR